jgi:hypothetical protein
MLSDEFYINCAQSYPQGYGLPKKKLKGKAFLLFYDKFFICMIYKDFFGNKSGERNMDNIYKN